MPTGKSEEFRFTMRPAMPHPNHLGRNKGTAYFLFISEPVCRLPDTPS